jgi:hypothetical protein
MLNALGVIFGIPGSVLHEFLFFIGKGGFYKNNFENFCCQYPHPERLSLYTVLVRRDWSIRKKPDPSPDPVGERIRFCEKATSQMT